LKTDHFHRSFQVFAPIQQVRDTDVPVVEHKAITGLKVSSVSVVILLTQRVDCWLAQCMLQLRGHVVAGEICLLVE